MFKNLTETGSSYRGDDELSSNEEKKSSHEGANHQSFEERAIENIKCDPSWPICLYDFTYRTLYPTFIPLKTAPFKLYDSHFGAGEEGHVLLDENYFVENKKSLGKKER